MATHATPAVTTFAPPKSSAELNAECLGAILAGQPLPDGLGPRPHVAPRPSSAREGIERILGIRNPQVQ